ncbi:MAG: DinB family protein [Gemmatimonadales bacterium]
MMVAELRQLYRFNAWANRRIFDALAGLPAEQYLRDLKSSHGGIHGTLCHIVWAEQLWLTRWLGQPKPAVVQGRDLASLADVRARWDAVEAERAAFLGGLTQAKLAETLTIQPTTGGAYVHTYLQTLQHTVDHSSYHRGQIITMLRQLGVQPPSTGLILFHRERASGREIPNF